jgi:hypothetical protein
MKFIYTLFVCAIFFNSIGQSEKPPVFVKKVYEDLFKNLYSTKQISKPVLQYFPEDKQLVIDYIPASGGQEGKIRVGSEFVKVLRSFGSDSANALAFVLGHELAHVFLEQSNIDRVGSGYADKELRKKLKEVKCMYTNSNPPKYYHVIMDFEEEINNTDTIIREFEAWIYT